METAAVETLSGTLSPLWALAIPAAGALLIAMSGRIPNLREAMTLLTAAALLGVVASWVEPVLAGARPSATLLAEMLPGIPLVLEVEPLGLIYALIAACLWIFNSIYSIGYMRGTQEKHQTRFYICFAVAIASSIGIACAGNLLTLFLFYETLTFSTYPLITHKGTPETTRSGRIYLGILLSTSIGMLLLGIIATGTATGTLDFVPGGFLADSVGPGTLSVLFLLMTLGVGKAAVMPFHFWLPAAMVAPTPVSALLHAVAVVKAGVFVVLKMVIYVFGPEVVTDLTGAHVLSTLAGATIIIAGLTAIRQDNLKARLAYSTIGQLAYIVLAASLATQSSLIGGGMHIVMHGFGKITLFFCAGAIYVATKKTKVSELDGLGRVMPVTMAAFLIGSLSIIGLPPLCGSWSKLFLLRGTLEAEQWIFTAVYLLSALFNLLYLVPISIRAFFPVSKEAAAAAAGETPGVREAPLLCVVPLTATACGCLLLFLQPELPYRLMRAALEVAG